MIFVGLLLTSHPPCLNHLYYREDHHKGKADVPETRGTEEGSAKRNIVRKHNGDPHQKEKKQGGGGGGKGKWNELDDGSMLEEE